MEIKNPLYQNQGIHVISTIFTIDKGIFKVLLICRKNDPFKDRWALPSGALYNNELITTGAKRELLEKTGLQNVELEMFDIFSSLDRNPTFRMIGVSFIGLIDQNKAQILKETIKTNNADWFKIDKVPDLAFDHNEILKSGVEVLKKKIVKSNILSSLYPDGVTLPELQKAYEVILNKTLDRRNFRSKMLRLGLIYDTNHTIVFEGKKPAKLYKFYEKIEEKNVF